jgi:hypothetical protein
MTPKLLLRIASILMLAHTVGHSIGVLSSDNAPTPEIGKLMKDMKETHFMFMGRSVTIASFDKGYGITTIFVLLMVTVLLWLLSNDPANRMSRQILPVLGIFLLLLSLTEYIYFFGFAASFSLLAGLLVVWAFFG